MIFKVTFFPILLALQNGLSANLWEYVYSLFWVEIWLIHNLNSQCLFEAYTAALETELLEQKQTSIIRIQHHLQELNHSEKKWARTPHADGYVFTSGRKSHLKEKCN